jgi:dihydroorotase
MPNLTPPVTTTEAALAYRQRILRALPEDTDFDPLMTLYLTDNTPADEIHRAAASGHIPACKLYPAGATTNSDHGVTAVENIFDVLDAMQTAQMVLCIHGEVTGTNVDVFDREAVFIETILAPLVQRFPDLKIVLEHITTQQAVEFVRSAPANIAATITPQHLLFNRNEIFRGGIRPHNYCLPILKRECHREALVGAATSGSPKFFLGTDSAPHSRNRKETDCGCAGCYTGYHALELYTTVFDEANASHRLEGFASHFGADFYGKPRHKDTVTLRRERNTVPASFSFFDDELVPLMAGESVDWRFID